MTGRALAMAVAGDAPRPAAARLGELFDTHHQRLYRLARRLSQSPDEARDLVQETFLHAARAPESIPAGVSHEEAWLVRVLVNITRDKWRLASLLAWSASANARADAQKPEPHVVVPVQPDESAPFGKKHGSGFDPLHMEGFSVALLLGEMQGASTSHNVPEGAKKALADLREFLPYKNYRLLDTQWIRCCAGPSVSGTLRGLDDVQYGYRISIDGVSGTKMIASFALDAGQAHFKSGNVTHDAFGKPLPVKRVISSNFSMETGETVVIGTSSLKGEQALVVLLTAVPRSGAAGTVKKGSLK